MSDQTKSDNSTKDSDSYEGIFTLAGQIIGIIAAWLLSKPGR